MHDETRSSEGLLNSISGHQLVHADLLPLALSLPQHRVQRAQQRTDVLLFPFRPLLHAQFVGVARLDQFIASQVFHRFGAVVALRCCESAEEVVEGVLRNLRSSRCCKKKHELKMLIETVC